MKKPQRLVIIDVDGLRRDVFRTALADGELPGIERIVGDRESTRAIHVDALSTAPSITFAAQASLFTGHHPAEHGIAGNESFDRLGRISKGRPRHFGFDVGYTLAVDDAVRVFTDGLASRLLKEQSPTLYEQVADQGLTSVVVHHMYARGADHWLPPDVIEIARFTKGKGALGLEKGQYDNGMLDRLADYLDSHPCPHVLTLYLMGLDHHSHVHGPSSQFAYLRDVIDPQMARLLDTLAAHGCLADTLFVITSDHGQITVEPDDRHSIRLGFPFDQELGHVFRALGLDVHDVPGEDPACDAVVGLNGGMAHVYLRHRTGPWASVPRYEADILPVAEAFRQMNANGKYESSLQDSLELILVRDTERDGWSGEYKVYQGDGDTRSLAEVLARYPHLRDVDAVHRVQLAQSAMTGDLILIANGREGFYFGEPMRGCHGGLLAGESEAVLTFAYPQGKNDEIVWLRETVSGIISDRCTNENGRQPSVADMTPAALTLLGG